MPHFDSDYVELLMRRLGRIAPDAVPRWGTLRRDTLIEHLMWVVLHSMGRSDQMAFQGNWLTRRLLAPLILNGWVPIPKNLPIPKKDRARGVTLRCPGGLDDLRALLEEYLNLVQADEFHPAPHPVFGDIGVDGWDKMHLRHFEHHLRQFGV